MARARNTVDVHYRIGSIAAFFIIATAVFFDAIGFLLMLTGIGEIVTEIMGITGAIMFFIWFMFLGVNYLSGRSSQKLGVMGVSSLVEAIPFLNGISPTFTIGVLVLIRITRKEDREKAEKRAKEVQIKLSQANAMQQRQMQQFMIQRAALEAANDHDGR